LEGIWGKEGKKHSRESRNHATTYEGKKIETREAVSSSLQYGTVLSNCIIAILDHHVLNRD